MDIKFIDGNIFSRLSASKPTYICQQVNCKGVMGAGLAMQIRSQWPVVYQRYLEFCYGNNGNKLGTYQEVLVEPKLYVVNLFGQNGYGRGERQTNYAALAAALFSFFRLRSKESERNRPAAIWFRLRPCRRRLGHGSGHHQRCSKSLESEC